MNLEYSGDFASFDCEKCFCKTRVVVKNEECSDYYCAYCGHKTQLEKGGVGAHDAGQHSFTFNWLKKECEKLAKESHCNFYWLAYKKLISAAEKKGGGIKNGESKN